MTEPPAAETVAEPPATQAAAPDYSGTGTMTLAPTSYPAGADVEWTCSDCFVFFLIALRGPIDTPPQMIVSEEHSGTGYIPPGNYTLKVSTSASGDWTMNVTPR